MFAVFSNTYNCVANTAATVYTINGSAAPYTFTIVNSATSATFSSGTAATSTGSTGVVPVGNYVIYISSATNCTITTSFQVVNNFAASNVIFGNTPTSCFGGSDGVSSSNVTSSFFTQPFSYAWSTGSTLQAAPNLSANTVYTVTITDAKGCSVSNTTSITEPPSIASTLTNTFINCYGTGINSNVTSTGGTPPFTYTVDGVACVGALANNLFAGTHTIITKDSKACLQTNTAVISQVPQPVISFTINKPSCPGKSDGSIISSVSIAPPPYTYTWQPGLSNASGLSGVPVGNYTLTVKDGSACITKSVAVVLPAASMSVNITTKPENCSAVDGAATLTISGGNFPYSYTTQPNVGPHSSNTIGSLSSGSYTTVITDGNSCLDTVIYNVPNLSTVSVSIASFTPVLCYNQCTGAIQLSVQNAVAPVTYSVSNTPTTSSSFVQNLCSGFYTVKATDAIGCPATTTINFPTPPVFSYSATAPAAVCFGKSVLLQGTASGGAGNFSFVWNPGNVIGQAVSLTPTGTTIYSLNVYDANGCTLAPFQLTVNVNNPLAININTSNVGICPGTTAQITPTITGGDGNYSYTWQPGTLNSASIFVQNASVPVYTLTVNDGCGSPTAVQVIPINLFPIITPLFTVSDTVGCGPLCTLFTNTTPKSTHAIWNYGDKPFEQQGNATNYCYDKAGIYNVKLTVNDSNNCRTAHTYSNVVRVLPGPIADFKTNPEVITLNTAENVLFENTTDNGQFYSWHVNGIYEGQSTNINYTFKDTGCYFVRLIAKNQNNCVDTADKFICVIEGFNFYMPNCITVNHDNLNDVLLPFGTGWKKDNYLFEIYNRWGARIFKTTDQLQGWDAKINDSAYYQIGVYYWRITITDNQDMVHELRGHVTIAR